MELLGLLHKLNWSYSVKIMELERGAPIKYVSRHLPPVLGFR